MANFLLDDFNDGVLDLSRIVSADASVTETGGKLNNPAGPGGGTTRAAYSARLYDLTKGRLYVQLNSSGSTHADVYKYFGMCDKDLKICSFLGRTTDASMSVGVQSAGMASAFTNTNVDTTVGLGPSLPGGIYLGVSYNVGTSTLTFAKSTNQTSWTTIRTTQLTSPTFDYRRCGLVLGNYNNAGGSSNLVCLWDNLTYGATDADLKVKVRSGGAWVSASVKVYQDGTWKRAITKVRESGQWTRPKSS